MPKQPAPIICERHGSYADRDGVLCVMSPGGTVPDDAQGCVVDCEFTSAGTVETLIFKANEFEAWRAKSEAGPFSIGTGPISDVVTGNRG